ncbi:kinesin-like protein KIN-12D [Cucurbita moschata]|uniref:Kinesin-like protein KIN-12D n=1 Tax=Cucurbita moschata TaxID=3662 RepID=A0A6J1G6F3_CUCMO|nr:kinesin-like protein KIN-12D [Cucurbita moschata]
MLRDFKFLRRGSGKNEELENVPVNPRDSSITRIGLDSSRPPLNSIQEPIRSSDPESEVGLKSRVERTPVKAKGKGSDLALPLRTPEKYGGTGFSSRKRFGWAQKSESGSLPDEEKVDSVTCSAQPSRGGGGCGNGGYSNITTPRVTRTVGRATSSYSESNSTQSTPSKSVSKPPNSLCRSKIDRINNLSALYKGIHANPVPPSVVNTVEVPHFDLKEDPSFWMEHNVQVLIRVRPLNDMERSNNGYNRCLKQESAQSITWIGQPETRFTFDHVACETVDQEMLFRMAALPMVENCLSGYNSCMFAYGQTGSGKTHTMLGEIEDLEVKPSPHRGITPRIFEFLFARIHAEEEIRRDEKLEYNCKCSFLEIYNEQITDLLDPSSTNLLLREDVKKGVYVENLSEFEVRTVSDILRLLTQGSSNRKVASTNMNRESSRSHSVFTCVIESKWEKDSSTNLRFARLNLVDLAGSERQKTSGAEGERLKEAANINKSLSTLGHVIMVLLDVARGKPRHIPYRDSRLTFLLQDSLGGNSKTMIIANVSPSICCAAETLNTLKFAQRAKLIQNNAIVNEDSTGDVIALQRQIQLLKEELAYLKRQNVSRSLSFDSFVKDTPMEHEDHDTENICDMDISQDDDSFDSQLKEVRLSTKQLKSLEITLAGALRREKMAEASIKQLEAEIEQLNRLVRQREEDTRSAKLMLKFREDKIQRMESLLGGSIPAETYLLNENRGLSEEIQVLRAKMDRNPEVTRFAVENIRLLDQLRRFQEFYEEGEREVLMGEVSKLRDQLLQFLSGNSEQQDNSKPTMQPQLKKALDELEETKCSLESCLEENKKLSWEVDRLQSMLSTLKSDQRQDHSIYTIQESFKSDLEDLVPKTIDMELTAGNDNSLPEKHDEEILNLKMELDVLKIILNEVMLSHREVDDRVVCLNNDLQLAEKDLQHMSEQCEAVNRESEEAKSIIEALESQQVLSINEIEELRNNNCQNLQLLSEREQEITCLKKCLALKELHDKSPESPSIHSRFDESRLRTRMNRMQVSLEKAKRLNALCQLDRECQASNDKEIDEVRRQAEAETAEVIVCMQEELAILQQQVQDSYLKEIEMKKDVNSLEAEVKNLQDELQLMTDNNESLSEILGKKDQELSILAEEWELLTSEMEEILADGYVALMDASNHLDDISSSFPEKRIWISEQVSRMIRILSEKDLLIEELRRCLEDANNKRIDMESMLKSLRGAALAITEAHQMECKEKDEEILHLTSQIKEKATSIAEMEDTIKLAEERIRKTSVCATIGFILVNRLSELNHSHSDALKGKNIQLKESVESNLRKDAHVEHQATLIKAAEEQIVHLREQLEKSRGTCATLGKQLTEEQEYRHSMQIKLDEFENDKILTIEKLAELKTDVSTLRSCMSSNMGEQHIDTEEQKSEDIFSSLGEREERWTCANTHQESNIDQDEGQTAEVFDRSLKVGKKVPGFTCSEKNIESQTFNSISDRDITITLLKKEIESALRSLGVVQAQMVKLQNEKKEMLINEKQNQQNLQCLMNQVLMLQETIEKFEKQSENVMEAFNHRLKAFEQNVFEASSHWCQTKELLEREVGEAKVTAIYKTAEASCILAKFEEAQETIKEADIMINELMIANETLKLEIERLREKEKLQITEQELLMKEVTSLQHGNILTCQQFQTLEKHLHSNLIDIDVSVAELEDTIAEVQTTVNSSFMSLESEIQSMKSLQLDSTKFVRSCFENIWSEIIGKDCAISVLHLCHMGILLETVMGLNAENGLLQHGLCESDAAVAGLREQNLKSKRELDMCKILKGKLLSDLKNSFHRIQKKDEEAGEMSSKLNSFEKKISDLQIQEEQMLERSNYMGHQLVVLMKELDDSNKNLISSLLDQELWLKKKENFLESQTDFFVTSLCLRDLESSILEAEIEKMALQKSIADSEHINCLAFLEVLKERAVIFKVGEELNEQLLQDKEAEVVLLQKEVQEAQVERKHLLSKLNESNLSVRKMDEMNKILEREVQLLKEASGSNDVLKIELDDVRRKYQALEAECDRLLKDSQTKENLLGDSFSQIHALDQKNQNLNTDLEEKNIEFLELQFFQLTLAETLCSKRQDFEIFVNHVNALNEENVSFRNKLQYYEENMHAVLRIMSMNVAKCVDSMDMLDVDCTRVVEALKAGCPVEDKVYHEMQENVGKVSKFLEEFEYLELRTKEVESENLNLQTELIRKDEVLAGLLFDLSLLQESASKNKDKKDELDEMVASREALDNELAEKSAELDKAIAHTHRLEAQLQDKMDMIHDLELNLSKEGDSKKLMFSENLELKTRIENVLLEKSSIEEELSEKKKVTEDLEMELLRVGNQLGQMNDLIEFLRSNLNELTSERDQLQMEVRSVKENLGTLEALAEENEANLMKAQQIAESQKIYAEEKEAEVQLLERSVEELEFTINVLENKVDIVKEDAEQQRLQREELELELHGVKNQMQNFRNADADLKRHVNEIEKSHAEACRHIQILEENVKEKIAEIGQLKAHISELNMHAEAQANEYKQKFKSLEAMAEQVRPEGNSTHVNNSSSNKMDKGAVRPRGSGSPFKCIGLGLAQQMKSEKYEELSAARNRIEELESLAVSRQKEIFSLNARLAAAESMTHDVIRDLLGVKLDMTTCMSLFDDNHQLQKTSESAQFNIVESQEKEKVIKLKKQLSEFVEERRGWLEEIDRKQAEMLALQVALEKLRHKDQLLKTENEMLKSENYNHKQKVMELEGELKKLSGQQNLQQRIHHHAKIKEENNILRAQNGDLSAKLHRTEILLSRVKEELAYFRTSIGKTPDIDFDEEQRLNIKLKETEEEKVQLARKLLNLCTSVLKAAGVTKPSADICPSVAEEALDQLMIKISSVERELQDFKFKNKIANERIRLSELIPKPSPRSSKTEDNCQSPLRLLQTSYFSALDR